MRLNPETILQREIITYLESLGGRVLRIKSQGTLIRGRLVKNNSKYSPTGIADLLFIYNGTSTFLEIKTPKELEFILKHRERLLEGDFKPSDKKLMRYTEQIKFIEEMKYYGCRAGFVSSIEETKNIIYGG